MQNLVKAYFSQGRQYYSESGESMRLISAMHPVYAENAASKLLANCRFWAKEAGVETKHPDLWMVQTRLFRALAYRAKTENE